MVMQKVVTSPIMSCYMFGWWCGFFFFLVCLVILTFISAYQNLLPPHLCWKQIHRATQENRPCKCCGPSTWDRESGVEMKSVHRVQTPCLTSSPCNNLCLWTQGDRTQGEADLQNNSSRIWESWVGRGWCSKLSLSQKKVLFTHTLRLCVHFWCF